MLALIAAVFLASVLGSLHCVGMCGAFLAFAVVGVPGAAPAAPRFLLQAAYHGGRLVTYAALGLVSGLVGQALDVGAAAAGFQRVALVLAGSMMIGFGVVAMLRHLGVRVSAPPAPAFMRETLMRAHRRIAGWSPVARALAVGLLTTLLPCGWLYAFAVTAAGTGSAVWGAATMAVFWVGTLPALVTLGIGLQRAGGSLARRIPLLTSVVLVGVGVWTLGGRAGLIGHIFPATPVVGKQGVGVPDPASSEGECHGR